jgi:hypothetical protein
MTIDLDAKIRDLVDAVVAEAPAYHPRTTGLQDSPRQRSPVLIGALVAAAIVTAIVVFSLTRSGGDSPASGSVTRFCAQLRDIKAMNESPPSEPDPTHGQRSLEELRKRYDRLERAAPTNQISKWLVSARPLLGHGLVRFTPEVEKAIPSAQKLRTAVRRDCGIEITDVFKVGFP